ncbi:hypothetical protein CFAM422_002169 [Trichoderma lentiforme]|uniref:Uncharacterized protein n=1 Tax=Trichoderma lentiforme TaxID=1567552 RepID=A0A9P4XNG6_9HYPO|nr:hypothetical protein CFAM422_002169 [Trichoderma lentiforme]
MLPSSIDCSPTRACFALPMNPGASAAASGPSEAPRSPPAAAPSLARAVRLERQPRLASPPITTVALRPALSY